MTEQLWTNERMSEAIERHGKGDPVITTVACVKAAKEMRDDLQARINTLEAENEKLRSLLASATESMQQQNQRISEDYDELTRLRAENARLRTLLPDATIVQAINKILQWDFDGHYDEHPIHQWLNRLEGEVGNE